MKTEFFRKCGLVCKDSLCLQFIFHAVLPVMLSSKLLPEMEVDDNSKREQLLLGMQNLPVPTQIDKLKVT